MFDRVERRPKQGPDSIRAVGPADHPLRAVQVLYAALTEMNARFNETYARTVPRLGRAGETDPRVLESGRSALQASRH